MLNAILSIDREILVFVHDNLRSPALTPLMVFFSRLGDMGLFWIAAGLLLLVFRRTRRGGAGMLGALAVEFTVCDLVLKKIFLRTRPYLVLTQLQLLVPPETSASFPSGHSASSFVCAYMLTRAFGKKGALAYIPACIIALSRIYVSVHYPSDVLCGAALGTAVGAVCWPLYRSLLEKIDKKRAEK